MGKNLIFDTKLTKEEISENKYWIEYILTNFAELELNFEKTKYNEVPISIKVISEFPTFAEFIAHSRLYLLNSYFISKKSQISWEEIQGKMQQKDRRSYLWVNGHSILRGNVIMGLITHLDFMKQKPEWLLMQNSNCTDDKLKLKVIKILKNIQVPKKDNNLIDNNLIERIKLVNQLLEEHYKLLVELSNI